MLPGTKRSLPEKSKIHRTSLPTSDTRYARMTFLRWRPSCSCRTGATLRTAAVAMPFIWSIPREAPSKGRTSRRLVNATRSVALASRDSISPMGRVTGRVRTSVAPPPSVTVSVTVTDSPEHEGKFLFTLGPDAWVTPPIVGPAAISQSYLAIGNGRFRAHHVQARDHQRVRRTRFRRSLNSFRHGKFRENHERFRVRPNIPVHAPLRLVTRSIILMPCSKTHSLPR